MVPGKAGYVATERIHFPPTSLIERDPGLSMVRVKPGQTFWGLVKEIYGIQGDEGAPDQNVNHFINAIRAINSPEAFTVHTGTLDDVENAVVPGRDASDTNLVAGVDLWIPSFGVAAAMDVGSGTVTGEVARTLAKIEQKIDDFAAACKASGKYIPEAIGRRSGEVGEALLLGLIEFAKDAATILAVSTAAGALIGALFGGVGAAPGAEIGFEIGLMILEYYGLAMLLETILGVAWELLSQLGRFISLAWTANGDAKRIEEAGKVLADALGILVSAVLMAVAAYVLKRGSQAFAKTKFARTVGEKPLSQWLKERQKLTTTREVIDERTRAKSGDRPSASGKAFVDNIVRDPRSVAGRSAEDIAKQFNDAGYRAVVERSTKKGTSGKSIQVRIEGHPEITNIQVHPGGGRHTPEGVMYWKISTSTQGKIWVVPKAFQGAESLGGKIVYYE